MNSQTLGTPRITIYCSFFPWGRWSVFKKRKPNTPSSISNTGLIDGVPPLSANGTLRFIRIIYMGQAHKSIKNFSQWTHPIHLLGPSIVRACRTTTDHVPLVQSPPPASSVASSCLPGDRWLWRPGVGKSIFYSQVESQISIYNFCTKTRP